MDATRLAVIAVGLSMDAFAVAIACGLSLHRVSGRHIFRLGFHFGLFQGLMPILGWLAGQASARFVEAWEQRKSDCGCAKRLP
jgi:putative Mn2+ efflux pump MntP